jgi:flavodoxin I
MIGLFFGTDTGNTERIAKKMIEKIEAVKGAGSVELLEIYKKKKEDLDKYDKLIIGMPTWYDGELQGDWEEFLPIFKDVNWAGKTVAFFGLGDQYGYASYFCDAIGIFADISEEKGATIVGQWPVDGYEHDYSKAEKDGKFVGLCLDVDNQDELTESRIDTWLADILVSY